MDFQGHGKLRTSLCVVKDDLVYLAFYVFQVHLTVFLLKNWSMSFTMKVSLNMS